MDYKIVFSDVDGTLLNSEHRILDGTLQAIKSLQKRGIPFVIVTARGPSGIYPIFHRYNFICPMVCYSGALILDENGKVLLSKGISKDTASKIIDYIEDEGFDCTWNVYSMDSWFVKDRSDPRVIREENIVEAQSTEGMVSDLPNGADIGKILCMCNPEKTDEIEAALKKKFPTLSIVRSSDILVEVMERGVTKGHSINVVCEKWGINPEDAIAFGDHYNDIEMLKAVGKPFLMGNAPEELKAQFSNITASNDEEGIYKALSQL
ncbi:hypothetical protein SAMN02910298_00059 [Pseudobutyrivibrio sp. YE44]|uniref:HAD family hydrolase n=1 Tax=Pseudobutyrivibrio sp. YE44 TaxID=1520802 RepID=UPI00088F14EA|nr:HAD family hydrolase [Pseudobutyrivibrio sp. YE44]SDB04736.1 hypothetical protein SAMN02910298_00059 [Pseudobutyrivibrio sp. YE44]